MREAVVSCGDSAEVLEAREPAFNGVAVSAEIRREVVLPSPGGLRPVFDSTFCQVIDKQA